MWSKRYYTYMLRKLIVFAFALNVFEGCKAITNADFNEQIRGYSVVENNVNLTDVKTLQKHGVALSRYASAAPLHQPIKFKDSEDNVVSESSHSRGLLHHGHTGYGFDYEDPIGHGYEYPAHDSYHNPHDYHHYEYHEPHHHPPAHGYGHGHHKYYDHGLAHKALLWPIAGIALLGAAAALVTNPVLLQLGVVSGKRKRRHIEDIEHTLKDSMKKMTEIKSNYKYQKNQEDSDNTYKVIKKRMLHKNDYKVGKRVLQTNGKEHNLKTVDNTPKRYSEEDRRFVPIPLKFKET